MQFRKIHRLIGLVMLFPLFAWAITGAIFLTKPGYGEAYQPLHVKSYPLGSSLTLELGSEWSNIKLMRSIAGMHLLADTQGSYRQYDPATLLPRITPTNEQVRAIIADAIQSNKERYGDIDSLEGLIAVTSTGVIITLNWDQMTLTQKGTDRQIIDTLYKIHYLQWTGWEGFNKLFGVAGLVCLSLLTLFGLCAFLSKASKKGTV